MQREMSPSLVESFSAIFSFASRLSRKLKTLSLVCRVAADWPETMHIVRLIAQEHMNKKFVSQLILFNVRHCIITFSYNVLLVISFLGYFEDNMLERQTS